MKPVRVQFTTRVDNPDYHPSRGGARPEMEVSGKGIVLQATSDTRVLVAADNGKFYSVHVKDLEFLNVTKK